MRDGLLNTARLGQHLNDRIESRVRRRREEEEMVVERVEMGEHLGADENRDDEREGVSEKAEIFTMAGEGAVEKTPCQVWIVGVLE